MKRKSASLLFFILLSACGDESGVETTGSGATALSFDDKHLLAEWEGRCVTDNKPLIELRYQDCLLAPGIYGVEGCANNKAENTIRLDAAWDLVKSTTQANFNQCMKDPRTDLDWCKGQYEFELSFYVQMKCQAAATWR